MTLQEISKDGNEIRENTRRFTLSKEDFEKVTTLVERQSAAMNLVSSEEEKKEEPEKEDKLIWKPRKYKIYYSTVSTLISEGNSDRKIAQLLDIPYPIMNKFIRINGLREEKKDVEDSI